MVILKRITIIDDSKEIQRRFLSSLPSIENIEFQSINIPPFFDEQIETVILRFKPDLIILGLLLSNDIESGFRVLRKLKKSKGLKKIPVVVVSKYIDSSENKYVKKAKKLGAVDAIPKIPFPKTQKLFQYLK